jgi:hypothetical protein
MGVAVDTSGASPITVGSFPNRVAIVVVGIKGQSGATAVLNSATFGGLAMTLCGTPYDSGGANNEICAMFYLVAPPTGSQSYSVSITGGNISYLSALLLYSADQVSPVRSGSYGSGTNSVAVSSQSGDMCIDVINTRDALGGSGGSYTVGAGQTKYADGAAQSATRIQVAASYEAATSTSTTMSWTETLSYSPNMVACAIKPATPKGQPVIAPFLSF